MEYNSQLKILKKHFAILEKFKEDIIQSFKEILAHVYCL